jgi:hypothetical protein
MLSVKYKGYNILKKVPVAQETLTTTSLGPFASVVFDVSVVVVRKREEAAAKCFVMQWYILFFCTSPFEVR